MSSEETQVDDVADVLSRLEEQVRSLKGEVRRLGASAALPAGDEELPPPPAAYSWLRALDVTPRRRAQVPRLLLEVLFLVAVATAAAIAELDAVAIAGVMVGAWVLVALVEWAASYADRRQELAVAPALPAPAPGADPAWYAPPVEQTLLDARPDDPVTAVTRLPPVEEHVDDTAERRP